VRILTLDFESHAIGERPDHYPPEPVGIALMPEHGEPHYLAWGHPSENNTTRERAVADITRILAAHDAVLCHNAPFDVAVMEERLGIDLRDKRLHDTLVLAFMVDPYAPSLSLKPQAERHLGMKPEERDAVRDWLIEHGIVRKSASRTWGAHIAQAPGALVGKYAIGDVVRTRQLYEHFRPKVEGRAYEREMRIARLVIDMERRGVLVDEERLESDVARFSGLHLRMQDWLRDALDAPSLVFTEDQSLGEALERRYGLVLPLTSTGKLKTSKDVIATMVPDPQVRAALRWEGAMQYNLSTYMRPFLRQAEATGGTVHAQWNAVRGPTGGGARTGRFSSSPNMQNLKTEDGEARLLKSLNELFPCAWELPRIRSYFVPPAGQTIIGRDYSQVELRIAAHYEEGDILAAYQQNPQLDLHQWVVDTVKERFDMDIERRIAKNVGFGILYGAGGNAISAQAGISYDEAVGFKGIYLKALPSLRDLMNAVQDRGRSGGYITTLGGRRYTSEPRRIVNGEWRSFEYKLLNYLIQGSAADLMKDAMLAAVDMGLDVRMTVHDEIVCYSYDEARDMALLRDAMHGNPCAESMICPVLSNGYVGNTWADTEDVE
jgi:DNA polymerase-1